MSDDISIKVHFKRVVQLSDNQGSVEAGIELINNHPVDESVDQIIAAAREQFVEIKALIYSELGLDYNQSDAGIIIEMFPGAQPVAQWTPPPVQLVVTDEQSSVGAQQQELAGRLGNVLVPPTGEPDLVTGEPGVPLPDPNELTDWQDRCWFSLLINPSEWDDTRSNATHEADFVAKDSTRFPAKGVLGNAQPEALYLSSKFGPAPAWVLANLHLIK